MIQAKRTGKPESLDKVFSKDGLTELQRAHQHKIKQKELAAQGKDTKSFEFSRYKSADVKKLLDDIFHGKCAYCESYYSRTQPVDVEHFRPKNKVDDVEGDSGYWWLAMDWNNLLPSCIDCNRKRGQKVFKGFNNLASFVGEVDFERRVEHKSGKAAAFPLRNPGQRVTRFDKKDDLKKEQRLLLDPTNDDPADHLQFLNNIKLKASATPGADTEQGHHNFGLISLVGAKEIEFAGQPDAQMGLTSIQIYGLNRLGLVQARTKILRDLEFLLEMSIELQVFIGKLDENKQGLNDIDSKLHTDLTAKLLRLRARILEEIQYKTSAKAEYSAMAQSWLTEKIKQLSAEINEA